MFDSDHIHIHLGSGQDDTLLHEILAKLETQETTMTQLSDAVQALTDTIAGVVTRIDEDVAHLQELLDAANANDAGDAAAIAELQADATATVERLNEATATLSAIDPVKDFPAEGETPVEGDPEA